MKTRTLLKFLGAIGVAVASTSSLDAAPFGSAFTYQGRLNFSGAPAADGLYDFRFTLHDAATLGSPVSAAVDVNAVPVTNGLFTAQLDFGAPAFTSGEARWLQLEVNTNGVTPLATLKPRQRLAPTPQAIYAGNAGTASAVAPGAVTTLGLAPDAVDGEVIFDGSISAADLAPSLLNGTFWKLGGNTGPENFLGSVDNQPVEFRANNQTALRLLPNATSPNLVGGSAANYVNPDASGAFIGGGGSADNLNVANGNYVAVVGGYQNSAVGVGAFIGGGSTNRAAANASFVGGGTKNRAVNDFSTVAGGNNNWATGPFSAIAGGSFNTAEGTNSTIGGGLGNAVTADFAFIGGGFASFILRNSDSSVVGGGSNSRIYSDSPSSVVGGGASNTIWSNAPFATVAGGLGNSIGTNASFSTIGGGNNNNMVGANFASTIAGGYQNDMGTNASSSTIGGGRINSMMGGNIASTIAGGYDNDIGTNSSYAAIGGGLLNEIARNAHYATIPGGHDNFATNYGFAAGRRAKANHTGSFVWADDTDADFASSTNKQFAVRANNGMMIQATNTALNIRGGGALRVEGAGVNSTTPVFIHRASAASVSGNVTVIDHPHCNGNPGAILIVTHNYSADTAADPYEREPVGVWYNGSRWTVFHENSAAAMPVGRAFNVMVVKP